MKLFVFLPSKFWGYCGGMAIATGNTFEEAAKSIQDHEDKIHDAMKWDITLMKFLRKDFEKEPRSCEEVDSWVLLYEITVTSKQSPICEINFNYA
jgi:hypothetical protein